MAAPDQLPKITDPLVMREPSIHGLREAAKNADLDFGGLAVAIRVSCGDAFTEGFEIEQVQRYRFK